MNLTVSRILGDTFAAMKTHFWGLVGLWAVFFALTIASVIVLAVAMGGSMLAFAGAADNPEALGSLGAGSILLIVLFYLAYLLIASAQYAAMNAMASPLKQSNFSEAFGVGWRSAPTLLVVMIILVIGYMLGALVLGVITGALSILGTVGSLIGAVVLFGGVLYLACRLLIVFPIVPVDGVRNPISAIARSWKLTQGNALPIFLSLLVFMVVVGILLAIVLVPTFGTFTSMAGGGGDGGVAPAVGAVIFAFVGIMVVTVLLAVGYAAYLSSVHALLAGGSQQAVHETFE